MQPAAERFLRSMQAAGVRFVPIGGEEAGAAPEQEAPGAAPSPEPAVEDAGQQLGLTPPLPRVDDPEAELATVAEGVQACRACGLAETRTRAVPGEGAPRARIVFVGEGPGADEDRTGRPFVGRAGKLLDDIITKGMRLRRQDVFICNVVKCRPPGNRVPSEQEMAACADWLDRQLAAIAPAVICALGATAVRRLLDDARPLGRLRGRAHSYRGTPVIVTYHPAYLLRNPAAKKPAWEDIQQVMQLAKER
jgi:DNA polymerase